EILNYVVAYSQDSQTQTNLPSQTTFYYYGEKNSTDATQWVRASEASGGDVLNQVVVLSGNQSALSNGLDALLTDATWLAAQPSLSIRRDFVYGAEDQVTEFHESGFTDGYSNYYAFHRYNMVEIDDNLNRYDEDGTDRSGDNTYHVEMRNMGYDGDDRLIHSEKLEYPPSASGTVTALDLDHASQTVSDITYVWQGGTEYAYVDVVTRALSPGAITLSAASTRFRVDGQIMTDATIDPTPAVAVDAVRDARLGRTTTTYALTEEKALAFNLRELLTNNGFDFFESGTAAAIHSSSLSDGAGLFPAVNSWFDNLIAAIGAGFIQIQAGGATYKIKIASVSDQTILEESYDGLSNLLRQVTEYATGVGANRVVNKTSIVENTYATVPGSAVKVLRSVLTTDYYGVYNAQAPANAPNRILTTTLNTYNITATGAPTDANVPVSLLKSSVTTTYLNPSDPAAPQTIRSIESSTYTYRSYADSTDPLKTRYETDHETLERTGSDNVTQTYTVNYQRDPNGVLQYKEALDALGNEVSMPEFYSWTQDILDELSSAAVDEPIQVDGSGNILSHPAGDGNRVEYVGGDKTQLRFMARAIDALGQVTYTEIARATITGVTTTVGAEQKNYFKVVVRDTLQNKDHVLWAMSADEGETLFTQYANFSNIWRWTVLGDGNVRRVYQGSDPALRGLFLEYKGDEQGPTTHGGTDYDYARPYVLGKWTGGPVTYYDGLDYVEANGTIHSDLKLERVPSSIYASNFSFLVSTLEGTDGVVTPITGAPTTLDAVRDMRTIANGGVWDVNATDGSLTTYWQDQTLDYTVTTAAGNLILNFDAKNAGNLSPSYANFKIEVFVDGQSKGIFNVKADANNWQASEIVLRQLTAGPHTVRMVWRNDAASPPGDANPWDANFSFKNLSFSEGDKQFRSEKEISYSHYNTAPNLSNPTNATNQVIVDPGFDLEQEFGALAEFVGKGYLFRTSTSLDASGGAHTHITGVVKKDAGSAGYENTLISESYKYFSDDRS
ncbi:MAG: hypothetical protein HYZ87_01420, partial [Candidatus Omnitrophica bacterium]|nr:hypothetical protein [Candidatus Omnitrophota bacterium]